MAPTPSRSSNLSETLSRQISQFSPNDSISETLSRPTSKEGPIHVRLPELPQPTPRSDPLKPSAEESTQQEALASDKDADTTTDTKGTSSELPEEQRISSSEKRRVADDSAKLSTEGTQDELIRQLKVVIRAQHAKIQELKAGRLAGDQRESESTSPAMETAVSTTVHIGMIEQLKRDASKDQDSLKRLTAQIRRLQNVVKDQQKQNEDLKAANRRYVNILSDASSSIMPRDEAVAPSSRQRDNDRPTPSKASPSVASDAIQRVQEEAPVQAPMVPSGGRKSKDSGTVRLYQAMRGIFSLWREETPQGILTAVMKCAGDLIEGGPSSVMTLYIVDPELRSAMDALANETIILAPTKFYLKGQVTVYAYQRRGGRIEPPRFSDLSQLPCRALGHLVLPLQAKDKPPFAVVQIVIHQPAESPKTRMIKGRAGQRSDNEAQHDGDKDSDQSATLADAQTAALELLCGTAANIIDSYQKSAVEENIRRRSEECLAIAAEISSVPRLTDFEHEVKILLRNFFNVAYVRICFFDSDLNMLLTVPTRPYKSGREVEQDPSFKQAVVGRRQLQRISLQDGIVGKCLRKQQTFHVEQVVMSTDMSERADGVDMSVGLDVNMLVGPMVANLSEKILLIGTLQIVEKKPRADADKKPSRRTLKKEKERDDEEEPECEPFSEEDQRFFDSLLKVLGLAAYRTMQLQARHDLHDIEIHVEKLMER